jgi:hypothetical protein
MNTIERIKIAIDDAENHTSDLPKNILECEGASGTKGRHLHNNLSKF